jgi:hypothetical protein
MSATHTVTPVLPADESSMSAKKGLITKCHACKNADLPLVRRAHCKFCLTNGYVASCLPCGGGGTVNAIAVWDGKSPHGSTCLTCGGIGCIPARLSEFEAQEAAKPKEVVVT